jgi:hypothetical protein
MRNFNPLAQIIPDLRKMSVVFPEAHCKFYFMQPINSPLEKLPLRLPGSSKSPDPVIF